MDPAYVKRYAKFLDALKTEFDHDYAARFHEMIRESGGAYPGVDPDTVYLLATLVNRDEITFILEMGSGYSTTVFGDTGKPYFCLEQHRHWMEGNREFYRRYGIDSSQIECTDAEKSAESGCGWKTNFEPVLPFTPDFVFCDGNFAGKNLSGPDLSITVGL